MSSRVARMLFFAPGPAAAEHETHGGAREAFICDGVDERTHGLARVETEPARWFFLRSLGRSVRRRARAALRSSAADQGTTARPMGCRVGVAGRPARHHSAATAATAGVAVNLRDGRSGGGGGSPVVCFRCVSAGRKTDGRNS